MGPVMAEVTMAGIQMRGFFTMYAALDCGADALRHQAAPFVFPEAHHCKSHHLGAAARYPRLRRPIP